MKYLAMILVALMCLGTFAACGSDKDNASSLDDGDNSKEDIASVDKSEDDNSKEAAAPVDTIYDVGEITVAVPEGWKAFNNTDIHADDPNTLSKNSVNVCKGGVIETDIFTKPYVKLDYKGEDVYLAAPMKDFYDNVVDIAPFELGGRTWEGFSCESLGYPLVILYIDEGDDQYQVTINCGQGDDAISLEDDEVRRIIASLTVKATDNSDEVTAE